MKSIDGRFVELEERLAAGTDDESTSIAFGRPPFRNRIREVRGCGKLSAVWPDADEISVAEVADGVRAIGFASRPEVAAGEPAEHRGSSGVRAFALKRIKDFLNGVHGSKL